MQPEGKFMFEQSEREFQEHMAKLGKDIIAKTRSINLRSVENLQAVALGVQKYQLKV